MHTHMHRKRGGGGALVAHVCPTPIKVSLRECYVRRIGGYNEQEMSNSLTSLCAPKSILHSYIYAPEEEGACSKWWSCHLVM